MKISWGTGILIAIIIFMAISLSMTFIFMSQDVHLVTDDYYEKEIKYQEQIDKEKRTKALNESVQIKFGGSVVEINFPDIYLNNNLAGEIFFYRPSNQYKDIKIPLNLNDKGIQFIPVERLDKGFWRIQLNWEMNGDSYYNERAIIIH